MRGRNPRRPCFQRESAFGKDHSRPATDFPIDQYACAVLARRLLPLVLLGATLALGGCGGGEPRFDLVPGPISEGVLWLDGRSRPCMLEAEQWACIDELTFVYRRDYLELMRREAVPLVRGFQAVRGDSWRDDATAMERFIAQHRSLIRGIEVLDDGYLAGLERCGLDRGWVDRIRVERQIDRCRFVIEGSGPSLLDLRSLVALREPASAETLEILDRYSGALAEALPGLREVEATRPLRFRREFDRREQAASAQAPGVTPSKEQRDAWEQESREAAAVPIRRALARVLDLNLATIEQLRGTLDQESLDALTQRFQQAVDSAHGGVAGDPVLEWQVEIAASSEALNESQRQALAERLRRFRERDRALADGLLQVMRRGEPVSAGDSRRAGRDALRKELLGAALSMLPQPQREELAKIGQIPAAERERLVHQLAPSSAAKLLLGMPLALREDPAHDDELPDRPIEMLAIFLPEPVNEGALTATLDRFELTPDELVVARQLWTDDAMTALRALGPLREATKAAEAAIGPALSDPATIARAIDAYFAAIDRERFLIATAEERYLDALAALARDSDQPTIDRLRWERRLARERIDWRFIFFGDGLGFTPEAAVTAVAVLAASDLEPHDRAVAEALLDRRLPELAAEAGAFRGEGTAAIRRLAVGIARAQGQGSMEEVLPPLLAAIASSVRPSVDRHTALHQAAIDELAEALPHAAMSLRRAWRRSAFPEYFLDDATIDRAVDAAQRRNAGDAVLMAQIRTSIERYAEALDAAEDAIMQARRAATMDGAPSSRNAIRDRLRAWPELAAAVAFRREVQTRLFRELACISGDPALLATVASWTRRPPPRAFWLYE